VRLVLVLLVVCAGLEIVTRALLLPRSRDFARFATYPARAEELVGRDGLRIAFIGNSATQRGLDPGLFVAGLPNPAGRPIHVDLFVADGAEVNTWHYMVKQSFWRRDLNPDWFVVTFFGNALEDDNTIEIGRLALFFTQRDDWPDLFALDLPGYSERAEFLLSTSWATFAARDRIRKRVLAAVVPDYKDFAEDLHAQRHPGAAPGPSSAPAAPAAKLRTCKVLERFLAAAKEHGNRVCFVAFPTRPTGTAPPYTFNPEVPRLIQDAGMTLVDLRSVPGLTAEHYEDDYHLTPAGAAIYTRHLTQAITPIMVQ
jgi:hypothetical protein